ncbi:MAG: histidine phosphatase family protein [Candidatus Poriferisodalaceae bacterium]
MGPIDVVVSSPLRRALQTAEPLGLPCRVDERWIELDYGEWDEKPIGEITKEEWIRWRSDPAFTPPGGESLEELDRRVGLGCEALLLEAEESNVAVFTHVSPIKSAVSWALGTGEQISWNLSVGQAQITRIAVRDGRPVLTSFNETGHLKKPLTVSCRKFGTFPRLPQQRDPGPSGEQCESVLNGFQHDQQCSYRQRAGTQIGVMHSSRLISAHA